MDKCTCKKGYGWKDFKCFKCGGDIRGIWYLTSILEEHLRKRIRDSIEELREGGN